MEIKLVNRMTSEFSDLKAHVHVRPWCHAKDRILGVLNVR